MGSDMYLNPPADSRGPKDRVVVVLGVKVQVYGPYRLSKATGVRTKLMATPLRGPRRVMVRKLETFDD
jgi:hypothetical protein